MGKRYMKRDENKYSFQQICGLLSRLFFCKLNKIFCVNFVWLGYDS